jgi:hypothetical protein
MTERPRLVHVLAQIDELPRRVRKAIQNSPYRLDSLTIRRIHRGHLRGEPIEWMLREVQLFNEHTRKERDDV